MLEPRLVAAADGGNCLERIQVAQTPEKPAPNLGALLHEYQEAALLSRELVRLSICARVAEKAEEALAAERVDEECMAKMLQLEEQLKAQL